MSGIYFVYNREERLDAMASLISSQMALGEEKINACRYFRRSCMGIVSNDFLKKGLMPCKIPDSEVSGVILGRLYDCSENNVLYDKYGIERGDDLSLFAALYMDEALAESLPGMNGAFSVILWNEKIEELVSFNDRYGLYPLYWSHEANTGRFTISSRVFSSVLSRTVKPEWNLEGVRQLLLLDDHIHDTTLLRGVRSLDGATILRWGRRTVHLKTYWNYNYAEDRSRSKEEILEELSSLFLQSIRRQTQGLSHISVTLSGGLDSRCIVAGCHKEGIPGIRTYTWGKKGCYDREIAAEVSIRLGTTHFDYDYNYGNFEKDYELGYRTVEGHINYFDCHMLAHLDHLRGSDTILNGFAGDLILGGSYLRNKWLYEEKPHTIEDIYHWKNSVTENLPLDKIIPGFSDLTLGRSLLEIYRDEIDSYGELPIGNRVDRFFLENRVRRQCSMGTVLMRMVSESASPFFDYGLVDFISSIPVDMRSEHKIYLAMMKEIFPEAYNIKWQRTLLPAGSPKILHMGMKGFLKGSGIIERKLNVKGVASRLSPVDFPSWTNGALSDWLDSVVNREHTSSNEVLSSEYLREQLVKHRVGEDKTLLLGKVLSIRGMGFMIDDYIKGTTPFPVVEPTVIEG